MRLVIPETLQQDFLHHYHASLEGGHQGIGRTYQRIRTRFHRRGLYRSVQRYVGECTDCETGKGARRSKKGHPAIYKQLTLSRSWPWTTFRRYPSRSKATLSYLSGWTSYQDMLSRGLVHPERLRQLLETTRNVCSVVSEQAKL